MSIFHCKLKYLLYRLRNAYICGLRRWGQPKWGNDSQKLVWEPDINPASYGIPAEGQFDKAFHNSSWLVSEAEFWMSTPTFVFFWFNLETPITMSFALCNKATWPLQIFGCLKIHIKRPLPRPWCICCPAPWSSVHYGLKSAFDCHLRLRDPSSRIYNFVQSSHKMFPSIFRCVFCPPEVIFSTMGFCRGVLLITYLHMGVCWRTFSPLITQEQIIDWGFAVWAILRSIWMIVFQFLPCLSGFGHHCEEFSMDSLTEPLTAMNGYLISLLSCGIMTKADISFSSFLQLKKNMQYSWYLFMYELWGFCTLYLFFFLKKHCYYFECNYTYTFSWCIYGVLADILHKLWHNEGLCLQSRL